MKHIDLLIILIILVVIAYNSKLFWGACTHLQNILFYDKNCIDNRFSNDSRYNIYLENLKYAIIDLIHQINQIQTELFARIAYSQSRVDKGNNRVDVIFNGSELFSDVATFKQLFNLLQNKIEVVRKILMKYYFCYMNKKIIL